LLSQLRHPIRANHHPTVKPLKPMRWLRPLACPPGGLMLDPFLDSGSTGRAAFLDGFSFIGVEVSRDYFRIAGRRIKAAAPTLEQAS
jgi:DNA modification methylase